MIEISKEADIVKALKQKYKKISKCLIQDNAFNYNSTARRIESYSSNFYAFHYKPIWYAYPTEKLKGYVSSQITFNIITSPFANCQNFSVPSFATILHYMGKDNLFLNCFLYTIRYCVGKPLLIVDLRDADLTYLKHIKEYLLEDPIINPYKSTNGSNMNICLLKLDYKKIPECSELITEMDNTTHDAKLPF